MSGFKTIYWEKGKVVMIDQRKLPLEEVYNEYTDYQGVADAIRTMVIRGAPAIGAAAAYGMALVPYHTQISDLTSLKIEMHKAADILRQSRPTAVNLFWAIEKILAVVDDPSNDSIDKLREKVLLTALGIAKDDVETNKKMAKNAQKLVPQKAVFIHHCNTGSLATVDYGTALGVIRMAFEMGKDVFVLVDETRPRLQGARLTAWELQKYGIPYQVIADGASGHFMRTMGVDLCVVGCDRVAANGDTANKIGTYNLAVVARENGVPFYVVGPTTTIDMQTRTGDEIEIEERPASEVTHVRECQITPEGARVGNPAFDVTPAKYITAIITEKGIAYPPYEESLAKFFE